jgi:hypothetical protein
MSAGNHLIAGPPVTTDRMQGDSGVLIVEAALVLPVILWLVLLLFDFAVLELKQTQVASAARDGVRAGIITWKDADLGSFAAGNCSSAPASFNNVCSAVGQRLAGTKIDSMDVECFVGQSLTADLPCQVGQIEEGVDTMVVTVTGTFQPVSLAGRTLLGDSRTLTSSARMVIQ